MSKIEEISFLKLLQGKTGNGLDSDIAGGVDYEINN